MRSFSRYISREVDESVIMDLRPIDLNVGDNNDGTSSGSIVCEIPTKKVPGLVLYFCFSLQVNVGEPTDTGKVKVFGPGVEPGVKAGLPTHFNIDCRGAGTGENCNLFTLSRNLLPENGNGQQRCCSPDAQMNKRNVF